MVATLARAGAPAVALQTNTTHTAQRSPSQASFPAHSAPLSLSRRSSPSHRRSLAARVLVNEVAVKDVKDEIVEEKEETAFQPTDSGAEPPSAFEVQSLLMELCDETSIAELKIKVGSFLLHVKRDVDGKGSHHPAPVYYAPPVPSFPMTEAYGAAGPPLAAPPRGSEPAEEEEVDEGLLYVHSPTVGILRRGRIYKGKRGRNLVEPGGTVKAGQVVCYIEQLSTQVAVESEHAGELVAFLADDGVAVGYGDPIVSVRPSFPGIKKLA